MADPKIIEYIKTNLDSGRSADEIRSALRQSSWSEEQINTGFQSVQGQQPGPSLLAEPRKPAGQTGPEVKKKGKWKVIIALIVFFLLLFLFLYVAAGIVEGFKEMFPNSGDAIPINIPFLS